MPELRQRILATAGHVDHGKSALVKALTGTDPDRLPEEKARGITIDLGFAHFDLDTLEATYSIGIVDVPGHEDFVKNMVAGVGGADLALLAVAADDGWMPQSEEHLQILEYLGVAAAVIALTKSDLAADRIPAAVAAVRAQLRGTPFADAAIVPTALPAGAGLDALRQALGETLDRLPPPRDCGKPRLPIDRVFTLRGLGTVVTGTLQDGRLEPGQTVRIEPGGRTARIRSLQTHRREVPAALPGSRVALNLPDLPVCNEAEPDGVARGQTVTLDGSGCLNRTLDVVLVKSPRLAGVESPAARPLRPGTRLRLHCGTANVAARVRLPAGLELVPGAAVLGELRCEAPVFAMGGDRFLLRDWSEQHTLAGGRVLDAEADPRHWRDPAQRRLLDQRREAPDDVTVWLGSLLARDGAVRRTNALAAARFAPGTIEAAADRMVAEQRALARGQYLIHPPAWQRLRQIALDRIDAGHREHPDRPGLPLNELRTALEPLLPASDLFDALLADIRAAGCRQSGNALARAGFRPALPPNLESTGLRLRSALTRQPFDPPSRQELAPDTLSQQTLRYLVTVGEAVELSAEVVLDAEAHRQAVERVLAWLRTHGQATVSELRLALGSSRRVMIPLLERLDRDRLTRRDGDRRTLGPAASALPSSSTMARDAG
jgi:selenocysteine-specific elongation factor